MSKSGPETRLVAKCRKAGAEKYGERLVVVKYHGGMYAEAGVSDLLCCLDGQFIAIEVKAPESYGGSIEKALAEGPTLKQMAFLGRIKLAGGKAYIVADVEGFMFALAEGIGVIERDT